MDPVLSILTQPISAKDRAEFKEKYYPQRTFFGLTLASLAILVIVSALLIFSGISVYAYSEVQHIGGMVMIVLGLIPVLAIIRLVQTHRARLDRSIKAYRFASSQGLVYQAQVKDPVRKGIIFSNPNVKGSFMYDLMSNPYNQPFEIGNYYYQNGSGDNQTLTSRYFGFISIGLNKKLPHIVLDATGNSTKLPGIKLSSFGIPFAKDQVLKLEGNFNDYFTLYVPKGYETDALYIFTPDLMARFIDNAGIYTAEIIDDRLYIYSGQPFFFDKPQTYEKLFGILETIGVKALKQTKNYSDARSDLKRHIAVPGRRLRRGLPMVSYIFAGVIIVAVIIANWNNILKLF